MRLAVVSALTGLMLSLAPAHAATVSPLSAIKSTAIKSMSFAQTSPLSVFSAGPIVLGTLAVTGKGFVGDATSLNLAINGAAGKTPFVLNVIASFAKNGGPSCIAANCSRFIGITSVSSQPVSVRSGNSLYTISATGFTEPNGPKILTQFTAPSGSNTRSLTLQGNVTVAPVPLPSAGLVLLGAIGAIAMIRRRSA